MMGGSSKPAISVIDEDIIVTQSEHRTAITTDLLSWS